ncbi:MAG: hypothetical protein F4X92_10490 [Gammaproteobacteria bacterium]|nr:hypothetical protein [Gammaproteobacteria bacterium]
MTCWNWRRNETTTEKTADVPDQRSWVKTIGHPGKVEEHDVHVMVMEEMPVTFMRSFKLMR